MADERYEWLDVDAAEKLLRGDIVVPADDRARTEALRLAAALTDARTAHHAGGELPGEARALAAFREASRSWQRDGAAAGKAAAKRLDVTAGLTGHPDALPAVRIDAGHSAPSRRRWNRPLRYGLVASLAGCALGGVAVAASTGMITGPFGGHGSPAPASSVSAAASPGELGDGLPSGDPAGPPSAPPAAAESAVPSDSSDDAEAAADEGAEGRSSRGPTGGATNTDGAGPDTGGIHDGSGDGTDGQTRPDGSADADSRELYEKSVRDCRDYRAGTLDNRSKRRLIRLAKGEDNLDRFCDRLLNKAGGNGGAPADGSGSGDNGDENGDSDGGDGGDSGNGTGGSLPSVSFEQSPSAALTGAEAVGPVGKETAAARPEPSVTEPVDRIPALR